MQEVWANSDSRMQKLNMHNMEYKIRGERKLLFGVLFWFWGFLHFGNKTEILKRTIHLWENYTLALDGEVMKKRE